MSLIKCGIFKINYQMKSNFINKVFLAVLIFPFIMYSQDRKCVKSYKFEIDSLLKIEKIDLAKSSYNNMIMSCTNSNKGILKNLLKKSNFTVISNSNINTVDKYTNPEIYKPKENIIISKLLKRETPPPAIEYKIPKEIDSRKNELLKMGNFDDVSFLGKKDYLLVFKDNKYGLYNSKFEELLPIEFDQIEDKYNYLIITKNDKQSIFDFKSEKITLPFFKEISDTKYTTHSPTVRNFVIVYKTHNHDNGLFFIDGKPFIDFPPEGKEQNIYVEEDEQKIFVLKNYSTDLIHNFAGKVLVSGYEIGGYYSNIKEVIVKNDKSEWGLIDLDGKIIIPFSDTEISDWGDFFLLEKNGKRGIMDSNGKMIIPMIYEYIDYPYYDTFVVTTNGKKGLINKFNRFVIEPKYDDLDNFLGDRLYYEYLKFKENELVGLMDIKGKIIIPAKYDYISIAKENFILFTVYKDKKVGIANVFGKEIIPPIYDKYSQYTEDDVLEFEKDSKIITIANPEIPPKLMQVAE